jgi:hypothetical protein
MSSTSRFGFGIGWWGRIALRIAALILRADGSGETYLGNDSHSVTEYFREIAEKRCVRFADYPFAEPRGWYVYSDRIMMPLSNDNDIGNMVFIYALWKDVPGRVSDPEDAP